MQFSICEEYLVRALNGYQDYLPLFHVVYWLYSFEVRRQAFVSVGYLLDERPSAYDVHVKAVDHVILHVHLQAVLDV